MKSCVLWHPGASISTSDVAAGLNFGLEKHDVRVVPYATGAHIAVAGRELVHAWKMGGKKAKQPTDADRLYHAATGILERACRARMFFQTEWVFIVSGMYQHPDFFYFLRQAGFKLAIFLTESPYDIEKEVRVGPVMNVVFTNERTSVDALRLVNPNSHYLPHAWHPGVHAVAYTAKVDEVAAHDVVFVGTYFRERVEFLASMDWTGINLGLYGGTDEIDGRTKAGRALKTHVRGGYIRNDVTAALYRKAKVGLNFHRTSKGFGPKAPVIDRAESMNPRCYELAAIGCYFLTDYRAEISDVFGDTAVIFKDSNECEQKIREALEHDTRRLDVSQTCKEKVHPHNWMSRVRDALDVIQQYDLQHGAVAA